MTRHRRCRLLLGLYLVTWGVVTALHAGQQRAEGAPTGTGAISGVVVDGTTGQPVAEAIVSILSSRQPVEFERQVTDSQGRFAFVELADADYQLTVERYGYLPITRGSTDGQRARPLVLAPDEWRRDLQIALHRAAVISGTVRDETSEPVVGVSVTLLSRTFVAGEPKWLGGPTTTTDDLGGFRFANLSAGAYVVAVPSIQWATPPEVLTAAAASTSPSTPMWDLRIRTAPVLESTGGSHQLLGTGAVPPPSTGNQHRVYPTTYFPAALSLAEAPAITVSPGEHVETAIGLSPTPAWGISGYAVTTTGSAAGQPLRLMHRNVHDAWRGSEAATAIVGADGQFHFPPVPPGDYTIHAGREMAAYTTSGLNPVEIIPGVATRSSSLAMVPLSQAFLRTEVATGDGPIVSGTADVRVDSSPVSGVELRLSPGLTIRGRVVQDETGQPDASTVRLFADPADGNAALGRPTASRSPDGSGRFEFTGVRPGRYFLRATEAHVVSVSIAGRTLDEDLLDATSGDDLAGLTVVTVAASRGARISGTIRGPVAETNVAVLLFPADPSGWKHFGTMPSRIRLAQPSANGTFLFPSVPAGDYLLAVLGNAREATQLEPGLLRRLSQTARPVSVNWGDSRRLDLVAPQRQP